MTIIFFSGNRHKAKEIEAIFTDAKVRIYTDFMDAFEVVEYGKSFAENAKIKLNALKGAFESQLDSNEKLREINSEKIVLMAEDSGICVESLDNLPNIFSARFANLPPLPLKNGESLEAIHNADSSDKDNITRLISELQAQSLSESKAYFVSCVACCEADSSLRDLQRKSKQSTNNKIDCHESAIADSRNDKNANSKIFDEIVPQRKSTNETHLSVRRSEADLRCGAISQKAEFAQILTTHGFLDGKVICEVRGDNGFGYDPIFVPNGSQKTLGELSSEIKNTLSHRKNALDLMRLLLK